MPMIRPPRDRPEAAAGASKRPRREGSPLSSSSSSDGRSGSFGAITISVLSHDNASVKRIDPSRRDVPSTVVDLAVAHAAPRVEPKAPAAPRPATKPRAIDEPARRRPAEEEVAVAAVATRKGIAEKKKKTEKKPAAAVRGAPARDDAVDAETTDVVPSGARPERFEEMRVLGYAASPADQKSERYQLRVELRNGASCTTRVVSDVVAHAGAQEIHHRVLPVHSVRYVYAGVSISGRRVLSYESVSRDPKFTKHRLLSLLRSKVDAKGREELKRVRGEGGCRDAVGDVEEVLDTFRDPQVLAQACRSLYSEPDPTEDVLWLWRFYRQPHLLRLTPGQAKELREIFEANPHAAVFFSLLKNLPETPRWARPLRDIDPADAEVAAAELGLDPSNWARTDDWILREYGHRFSMGDTVVPLLAQPRGKALDDALARPGRSERSSCEDVEVPRLRRSPLVMEAAASEEEEETVRVAVSVEAEPRVEGATEDDDDDNDRREDGDEEEGADDTASREDEDDGDEDDDDDEDEDGPVSGRRGGRGGKGKKKKKKATGKRAEREAAEQKKVEERREKNRLLRRTRRALRVEKIPRAGRSASGLEACVTVRSVFDKVRRFADDAPFWAQRADEDRPVLESQFVRRPEDIHAAAVVLARLSRDHRLAIVEHPNRTLDALLAQASSPDERETYLDIHLAVSPDEYRARVLDGKFSFPASCTVENAARVVDGLGPRQEGEVRRAAVFDAHLISESALVGFLNLAAGGEEPVFDRVVLFGDPLEAWQPAAEGGGCPFRDLGESNLFPRVAVPDLDALLPGVSRVRRARPLVREAVLKAREPYRTAFSTDAAKRKELKEAAGRKSRSVAAGLVADIVDASRDPLDDRPTLFYFDMKRARRFLFCHLEGYKDVQVYCADRDRAEAIRKEFFQRFYPRDRVFIARDDPEVYVIVELFKSTIPVEASRAHPDAPVDLLPFLPLPKLPATVVPFKGVDHCLYAAVRPLWAARFEKGSDPSDPDQRFVRVTHNWDLRHAHVYEPSNLHRMPRAAACVFFFRPGVTTPQELCTAMNRTDREFVLAPAGDPTCGPNSTEACLAGLLSTEGKWRSTLLSRLLPRPSDRGPR